MRCTWPAMTQFKNVLFSTDLVLLLDVSATFRSVIIPILYVSLKNSHVDKYTVVVCPPILVQASSPTLAHACTASFVMKYDTVANRSCSQDHTKLKANWSPRHEPWTCHAAIPTADRGEVHTNQLFAICPVYKKTSPPPPFLHHIASTSIHSWWPRNENTKRQP